MEQPNINLVLQVDWNKVSGDSASVADKIKKKLHIQSKSGWEKFQVLDHHDLLSVLLWIFRNGPPRTSTWPEDSLADSSSASPLLDPSSYQDLDLIRIQFLSQEIKMEGCAVSRVLQV